MADVKKYFEDTVELTKWILNWALRTIRLIIKSESITPTGKVNLTCVVLLVAYSLIKAGEDFTGSFIFLVAFSMLLSAYDYHNQLRLRQMSV